jgi:uncharacterized RDD family membrane protein YckC
MNMIERYIQEVMQNIYASPNERDRMEADLRAHFTEALARGEAPAEAIARMGSPRDLAEEFMSGVTLHYASFWLRLVAFIIDLLIITIVNLPLAVTAIWFGSIVPQQPVGFDYVIGAIEIAICAGTILVMLGIVLLYFPILEGRFGQTIGKRLLKLHVLKESGVRIGYKEAFIRRLSYYFDFLLVDSLFIFFTSKKQRAFDVIARTVVVRGDE